MNDPLFRLPYAELEEGVRAAEGDLLAWRGARVLMTGCTGFLGSWLLASLAHANKRLGLNLSLELVTRRQSISELGSTACLRVVHSDVRHLRARGHFDLVIHGAASSSARFGVGDGEPREMISTIVDGTRRVLDASAGARMLLISSGAVYGRRDVSPICESDDSAPDPMDPESAYGQAKRLAESLVAIAGTAGEIDPVVARLFTFIGPRIPLHAHFAAGNFLADYLARRPVKVRGNGEPVRSYMYAGDLPEWCWALLTRGKSGTAYNVGSARATTIACLAKRVAEQAVPPLEVEVLRQSPGGTIQDRYVPCTCRAERELALRTRTEIDEALVRTIRYHRNLSQLP